MSLSYHQGLKLTLISTSGFNNDPWRFVTKETFHCVQLQAVIKFKSDSIKRSQREHYLSVLSCKWRKVIKIITSTIEIERAKVFLDVVCIILFLMCLESLSYVTLSEIAAFNQTFSQQTKDLPTKIRAWWRWRGPLVRIKVTTSTCISLHRFLQLPSQDFLFPTACDCLHSLTAIPSSPKPKYRLK